MRFQAERIKVFDPPKLLKCLPLAGGCYHKPG
jgi:hypothetical protein